MVLGGRASFLKPLKVGGGTALLIFNLTWGVFSRNVVLLRSLLLSSALYYHTKMA